MKLDQYANSELDRATLRITGQIQNKITLAPQTNGATTGGVSTVGLLKASDFWGGFTGAVPKFLEAITLERDASGQWTIVDATYTNAEFAGVLAGKSPEQYQMTGLATAISAAIARRNFADALVAMIYSPGQEMSAAMSEARKNIENIHRQTYPTAFDPSEYLAAIIA